MSLVGFIYLVTNLVNGKKYVGCSERTVEVRWSEHQKRARQNSPFAIHAAIRKYGADSFKVETIEVVEGLHSNLVAAEVRQIVAHDCVSPKGYNLTKGGDGVDFSTTEVRDKHLAAIQKLVNSLEWQRNHAEAAHKRSLDPVWRKNVVAGGRKRAEDPKWQRNHAGAAHKRSLDPVWRKNVNDGAKKRAADPVWQANQLEGARKRSSDTEWQSNFAKMIEERSNNPEWHKNHTESMRRRSSTQEWQDNQVEGARKRIAKTDAKYSHLPLEEQKRRAKKREQDRVRSASKKATLMAKVEDKSVPV
jgi:group I intron endonuclease